LINGNISVLQHEIVSDNLVHTDQGTQGTCEGNADILHMQASSGVTREGGERRRGGTCHPLDFPLSVGVIHGGFFMGDALQPIIPASECIKSLLDWTGLHKAHPYI
ncbi:hypothetical protein Bbelb_447220, partial [Branchiostoma belcheri]